MVHMNPLVESGVLIEKQSGANFMYILGDSKDFLITEYKVLQSQRDVSFIPCMKLLYNGRQALYYQSQAYRTLKDLLPNLDSNGFMNLASYLLRTILDVQNNGFLSCQNIDLSFDKIFVDASNLKVSLVYIPIQKHAYADYSTFEAQLRGKLIDAIHQGPMLQSPSTAALERDLSDISLNLSAIAGHIRSDSLSKTPPPPPPQTPPQQLRLVALRAPTHFELVVNRDTYLIGKKAGAVHGVISYNSAISRIHCQITRHGTGYKIEDLGSANGTFVNRQKLVAHKAVPLKHGDIIRLANSDFQVSIR